MSDSRKRGRPPHTEDDSEDEAEIYRRTLETADRLIAKIDRERHDAKTSRSMEMERPAVNIPRDFYRPQAPPSTSMRVPAPPSRFAAERLFVSRAGAPSHSLLQTAPPPIPSQPAPSSSAYQVEPSTSPEPDVRSPSQVGPRSKKQRVSTGAGKRMTRGDQRKTSDNQRKASDDRPITAFRPTATSVRPSRTKIAAAAAAAAPTQSTRSARVDARHRAISQSPARLDGPYDTDDATGTSLSNTATTGPSNAAESDSEERLVFSFRKISAKEFPFLASLAQMNDMMRRKRRNFQEFEAEAEKFANKYGPYSDANLRMLANQKGGMIIGYDIVGERTPIGPDSDIDSGRGCFTYEGAASVNEKGSLSWSMRTQARDIFGKFLGHAGAGTSIAIERIINQGSGVLVGRFAGCQDLEDLRNRIKEALQEERHREAAGLGPNDPNDPHGNPLD